VQKQFQQIEEQIAATTDKKAELEKMLASPETYSDKHKFLETEAAFQKTADALVNLQNEYEKIFEKLIALEQ
jgi:ATP-binding cassette subfamily F protein 3